MSGPDRCFCGARGIPPIFVVRFLWCQRNPADGRFVVSAHRAGDPAGTMYQIPNNGLGQPVRLTDMNTAWWNTAQGLFLTTADVPQIDRVEIDVMADSVPFTVSNLCLGGIVFGN